MNNLSHEVPNFHHYTWALHNDNDDFRTTISSVPYNLPPLLCLKKIYSPLRRSFISPLSLWNSPIIPGAELVVPFNVSTAFCICNNSYYIVFSSLLPVVFPTLDFYCIRGKISLIFLSFNKHLLNTKFDEGSMRVARDTERKGNKKFPLTSCLPSRRMIINCYKTTRMGLWCMEHEDWANTPRQRLGGCLLKLAASKLRFDRWGSIIWAVVEWLVPRVGMESVLELG